MNDVGIYKGRDFILDMQILCQNEWKNAVYDIGRRGIFESQRFKMAFFAVFQSVWPFWRVIQKILECS